MLSGKFTLADFLNQIKTIQKMGSLKDLVEKMPGMGGMLPAGVSLDDKELVKIEAMIQSMTRFERDDPQCLIREPRRAERVAKGSATPVAAINELVQKFQLMQQMMGGMMGGGGGLMSRIPGMNGLNMARNARRMLERGKMPPGMDPNMFGGIPGMPPGGLGALGMGGFGGMGGALGGAAPVGPKMKVLSRAEKNSRKTDRKQARSARKKNRK
jgi:signal recognition particle subunit SRP54